MRAIGSNFLNWCARQGWDWLFVLVVAATATPEEVDGNFRRWIQEIERADGTLDFCWIRLVPVDCKGSLRESYVLVGGLSSGEWWYWAKRWKAINSHADGHAGVLYSPRRRRGIRLNSALHELLSKIDFDVQMQLGVRFIRRRRTLKVDEDGLPLDKKMRRNLSIERKGFKRG